MSPFGYRDGFGMPWRHSSPYRLAPLRRGESSRPTTRPPSTVIYTEKDIQDALAAAGGTVKRIGTPFPGTSLYVPNDGNPHPGIVVLHGSDGGSSGVGDMIALRWAAKGYSVLAYDYFGSPGLPSKLANVDLADTIRAIDWLGKSDHVGGKSVALWGGSRGAEQALLLASLLEETDLIKAVAVHAPYASVVGGFDPATGGWAVDDFGFPQAAWRLRSKPIRHGMPIAIENFKGPVFISHGTADELWSVTNTQTLASRMRAAGRKPEIHYLEGEGHTPSSPVWERTLDQTLGFFQKNIGS